MNFEWIWIWVKSERAVSEPVQEVAALRLNSGSNGGGRATQHVHPFTLSWRASSSAAPCFHSTAFCRQRHCLVQGLLWRVHAAPETRSLLLSIRDHKTQILIISKLLNIWSAHRCKNIKNLTFHSNTSTRVLLHALKYNRSVIRMYLKLKVKVLFWAEVCKTKGSAYFWGTAFWYFILLFLPKRQILYFTPHCIFLTTSYFAD